MKSIALKLVVPLAILAFFCFALAVGFAPSAKSVPGKYCGRTVGAGPAEHRPPRTLDDLHESGDVNVPIPDRGVATATINITGEELVTDINVRVNITHTWVRDLYILLIAPNAIDSSDTVMLLREFPGDSVENLTDCWFDDEAARGIYEADTPITGSYRPREPLTDFDGSDPNGTWTLRVADEVEYDSGAIVSWAIEVNRRIPLSGSVVEQETRAPIPGAKVRVVETSDSAVANAQGRYELPDLAAGIYSVLFSAFDVTLTVDEVEVIEGASMVLDTSLLIPKDSVTFLSTSPPVQIPDNDFTGVDMALSIAEAYTIFDLDATVNIEHTWIADLRVSLISPTDIEIRLVDITTESQVNLTDTRLDDEASLPIDSGEAPFTGRFRPTEPLSAFDGSSSLGTWRLHVADFAEQDIGQIVSFALHATVPEVQTEVADEPAGPSPADFTLFTNYPNPFNSSTQFRFSVNAPQQVAVTLYDVTGRKVSTLLDGHVNAGEHVLYFAAHNMASGIYFARLETRDHLLTRKIALIK